MKKVTSSRDRYEIPLLASIYELGGAAKPDDDLYARVGAKLEIPSDGMAYDRVHAKDKWIYELQWVRFTLRRKGELMPSERGIWRLGPAGLARLKREMPQVIESDNGALADKLERAWQEYPPEGPAAPGAATVVYALTKGDIQTVAEDDLGRPLTEKEARLIEDKLGDYVSWYDAISQCIRNWIKE